MSNEDTDIADKVWAATLFLDVTDRNDAARAADQIIDQMIDYLGRDSEVPERAYSDWRALLGDLHRGIEDLLAANICNNRVNLSEVTKAIIDEIENPDGDAA
jgi:hypothetical protein